MAQGSFGKAGIIPPVVLARPSSLIEMSCRFALMCCIALCGTVNFASSCDAAGMQKCNQDYFSAVPQASGNQSCVVMDTFLSCMNTACAGCQDAVKQQFNAIVSPVKSGSACRAGATCATSTICAASEPLTCTSGGEVHASGTKTICVCIGVVVAVLTQALF